MADSDFTVKAIISAQTSQFEKGMKDAQKSLGDVSKSIQNVSNLLKSAFSIVGIGMSIKAVADFGSSCVKAADDANKSFSILNNTINVTGATAWTSAEKMEQMSVEISNATNYSVGEIQDMQSVLLGFRNITGDTFREASDAITDMATVMGMDLKSAVQTVGKALDDPIKGLDSLKRQGFAFTEEQKEELAMLVKTGKQMEAQKIILDELNTTYGGAAKAAQSATARWNHAMDSFKESIGNQLMPAVNASTEQMIKVLKKITEFVNSSEFNQIVIVLTNIANKVKEVFVVIGNYISEVFTEIMEIFNKVDFSPFKSVLDALLGSIIKIVDIIRERIAQAIAQFKSVTNEIGNIVSSLDLEGISEYINAFIDGFWFIYDEVQKVTQEIQDWITEKVIWIWEKIKELFNNSNEALANSESSIKSWGDYFWNILDNVFRIFQDLINSVKAILDGDWAVAWEYAKLTLARWADNVLTLFSTVANAFPQLINGIIDGLNKVIEQVNKVREFFGDDPIGLVDAFSSVDLSEKSGLNKFISDTEKKIEELTGKVADISIKNLKGISTESEGTFDKLKSEITATGNVSITTSNKSHKTYKSNLNSSSDSTNEFFNQLKKGWQDLKEEIEKDSKDWSDVIKTSYTSITNVTNNMFVMMGENLAGASNGYQEFSATAVEGISEILKALAAQITALGVTHALTMDFAGAALAAAGAAAALAAAGALGAVAKNMRSTAEETSAVTAALEEFIKLLNELRSGKLTSSEFASSFVSLRKVVKDTNDYLYKSMELFANVQEKYSKFYDVVNWRSEGDMAKLRQLEEYLEDVKDNLYLATVKQSLALASYNTLLAETVENQKKEIASGKELSDMYETLYSDINKFYELLRNEQMIQVQGLRTSLLESMTSLGADIGKMLTDGIKSGASKSDFAESLKELIRGKMIEIAVYTDQFQNVLADAGTKLMSGIAGGDDSLIQQAKEQIEALYDTAVQTAEIVDKKLSSIFKSIKNTAKSATSSIAESMKSISETAVTSLRNLAGSQKQISSLLSGLKVQSRSWETVKSVSTSLLKSSANSAKTTLEAAKKNLETQQKALDNASKKLNDSKAKLATAQQNLALSPYYGDLGIAIASQAYNQALLEQTVALSKYEKAEQKKNEAQQKSNSAQLAYNNALSAYEEKLAEVNPYLSQINEAESKYNALISETKKQLSSENVALKAQIESYRDLLTAQKDTVGFQAQIVSVRNQVLGIYDELSASALSLGESLVNAIASGMNKKDFSLELKDYIRQNIIKLNVYGGEMGRTLATAGERLTAAIISQDSAGIKSAKSYMMSAYNEIDGLMKNIDKQLDDIFGVAEKTAATVQKTEESVSSLQRAIKSFKETVSDLGGDIANNLVSSLSSGLDVNSAMLGFKKFLREYIVKAYVFTESMKGEIEKIGKLIGKTLDGSVSKNELSNVANTVKATYGKLADSMKAVDTLLDSVFGKEAEKNVSSSASTVVKNVSKIQQAIDNLKDSLKDLGGDVAGNFISSLNSGLDLDSALISLKKFIRNYVIQSAVYTNSLKSEMEKIGQGIADYIMGKNSGLDKISSEFKKTYNKLANNISKADEYLDKIFGKEKEEEIKDSSSTITKELSKIESAMKSFKETVSDLGGDVAEKLTGGLKKGLSKNDMLATMKDYIKDMVIQSVVYTDSMKLKIESISKAIANLITGSKPKSTVTNVRNVIGSLYNELAKKSEDAFKVIDEVFPDMSKTVEQTAEQTEKSLSKLESAIDSFKETVSDLGGDIASNLIDGLANGLSQSDFLSNMKDWIKKMLVQSVVYTEQMKSEIETIGKTISNAISGGFTETSMHEIRRDLSFIFEQASSKMSGIDKVLGGVFDGYASGTTSALSGLHIVGEAGPELVRFNGGERVYNNADTMKMISGAGKTNNMNITFNNIKDTSAFAMMSQLKQYQRELAINGVL